MNGRAVTALGLVLLLAMSALAQRPIPPAPQSFVYDEVDWLNRSEEQRLSQRLLQYERDTSNQIVVALFRSLEGEALGDFSQRVAEAWRVGQEGRDNGVLLAVYAEDRQVAIVVGYGLEPVITDLIAAQILDETLRPALRAGRYAAGIDAAVVDLAAAAAGEFQGSGRARGDRRDERGRRGFPPIGLILFILFMLLGGGGVRRNMLGAVLLSSALGGGRSRGGFGGGGFSGGGGSFGGGGARGGW